MGLLGLYFDMLGIEKTCGTDVSHVEDQPNVADSIWQLLSYLLPLDGVCLAVAEDEEFAVGIAHEMELKDVFPIMANFRHM